MSRLAAITALVLLQVACAAPIRPAPPPPSLGAYTPSAPLSGETRVAFTIPRRDEPPSFFDLPWPSELSRLPNGRPDFRAFPGREALLFDAYVDAAERDVEGFGLTPAIYFRVEGAPESLSWPRDPRATMSASAPIFLVDVDPQSPERGSFLPIAHRVYDAEARFVPARTFAVKPIAGVVLRPSTLYAAVVRRELGGRDLGTTMDLEIVKWTSPRADAREERARELHAHALDLIASLGAPRDRIAALALFRTHAPHAITARLVDAIEHLPPGKKARVLEARWNEDRALAEGPGAYRVIEGTYCTPNFQAGIERAPFVAEAGGRIALDEHGVPRLAPVPGASRYHRAECGGLLHARFVMSVPARPAPPGGYPLMVSAHGTGGSALSFLGKNDFAGWAAAQGIAVVSTDQPLHGGRGRAPRPGSREPITISIAGFPLKLSKDPHDAEVAFYNPLRPYAARDNLRQAAADAMVLARLFTSIDLGTFLPPDPPAPRFDRSRILAAGHSQGSQSLAVVAAVDPLVRGVILSGCGGDARLGVLRREDLPVVTAITAMIGFSRGELDEFHPFMTLLQTLADPIDPASYARLYWDPLPGRKPPSVLHYQGMGDSYTPNVTAEALAVALKATPIAPAVTALPWIASKPITIDDILREATPRLFAQIAPTKQEDGHFVIYHEPEAVEIAKRFMRAVVSRP